MIATLTPDSVYITSQIRSFWNALNPKQKATWLMFHDLAVSLTDFDDLPGEVQDKLFCEYLDNAKRSID